MPLAQLQGLTPLGGGRQYGMGQPPGGDGTDPNADPNAQHQQNQQRRPQNTGAPSSSPGQAPTFAQMQAQGRARPAPPQAQPNLAQQANQSASQALSNPSAYGAPQVQQAMDTLNQGLQTQATLGRRQIDETMAQRGLYDSTATGDKYGLLQAQQDQARAQMATTLANTAAQTYGADRSTAIQNAGNLQNQQATQGLAQQAQNLNQTLGYAGLSGNLNGQSTLAAQQQAQNYALGQGQLGVAQQQANTSQQGTLGGLGLQQQQITNQNQQFGQNLGLQSALGYGNLGLQQQQVQNQASQFGQQFGLSQLQNQQQYGLAQQNFGLQSQLGLGNLSLAQLAQQQNYGLGLQGLQQQGQYQQGQLALGQNQINAGLQGQSMQQMGNLAYAGLMSGGGPPSQDWINFLMGRGPAPQQYTTGGSTAQYGGQSGAGGGPGYQGGNGGTQQGSGSQLNQTLGYGGYQYPGQSNFNVSSMGNYGMQPRTVQTNDAPQQAADPTMQGTTPRTGADATTLDDWWKAVNGAPRYSQATNGGGQIDNALMTYSAMKNTMTPEQFAAFANTNNLDASYQQAMTAANTSQQYALTHGGWGSPTANPNANGLVLQPDGTYKPAGA